MSKTILSLPWPKWYGYAWFWDDKDNNTIRDVQTQYCIKGIRQSDTVLDIGANIGAFSLLIHKKCYHVYALEPVKTEILQRNIMKNSADNITIIDGAISEGSEESCGIEWRGTTRKSNCYSLQQIIDFIYNDSGHYVDFIKIDCEGCEYLIKSYEIDKNVRRIEAEVHNNVKQFENIIKDNDFNYNTKYFEKFDPSFDEAAIISAWKF